MNGINSTIALVAVACAAAAALVCMAVFLLRQREQRTYRQLNELLDRAMSGTLDEGSCDETALSALQSKLNRYLNASLTSERNLAAERNKIKALISDISHQTKTPIANLLLYSQLLQEQPLPEPAAALAGELTTQAEKLRFLIQALVKTSRLETGIIAVSPALRPVLPLVAAAVSSAAQPAAEKGITLSFTCDEALTAAFDAKWTEEAVANLIDNAIKYTPAGGQITVSAAAYEIFTRIDVADTGIGIEEHEIPLLFNRFYRSPTVSTCEGVGLGLYLAREILSAQGGYIKVKSSLGKGSVFSVFLPSTMKSI